jgi:hypothetical protein
MHLQQHIVEPQPGFVLLTKSFVIFAPDSCEGHQRWRW